jgi:hypothetical protein
MRAFTRLAPLLALLASLLLAGQAAALPSEEPFEVLPGSFHFTPSGTEAGAHADWTTSFDFAHGAPPLRQTVNDSRSVVVNLPVGFIGNNTAVPTCTGAQLLLKNTQAQGPFLPDCPIASQVGQITFDTTALPGDRITVPLYNMEVTSPGIAAQLGFKSVVLTQILSVTVRPGDSGLTVTASDVTKNSEPSEISVTVWGLPASREHDEQRGGVCSSLETPTCHNEFGAPQPAGVPVKPFLSNPTSCGPSVASMKADSWEHPGKWFEAPSEVAPIGECERVPFEPSVVVQPTTAAAESPSGLNVSLLVPQEWESPTTLSTANLKDTVLALPVGYTINPGAGSGLGVCTLAQLEAETSVGLPNEGCPEQSKIGSVLVETPVLAEPLEGAIYVAKPFEAPFAARSEESWCG